MARPTSSTVKRLFAVSGNQCAFPGCTTPLVDTASGSVLGEICHIKAQSPDGPRYDPSQSEKARHGFKNLLLLCPTHHKIVDDNPDTYPVEKLLEIKAQHEKSHTNKPKPSDEITELFLTHIGDVVYGDKFDGDKVLGDKITIHVTYQGAQAAIPSPEAIAAHRAALREKLEADAHKRWGGIAFYIQEEGATLPVEASPYQAGRLGAREDLLQTLSSANRLLMLGEPGSGKTVSLERLAWKLCGEKEVTVPVLVPLRDYAEKSLAEWVLSFLRETRHLRLDDEKALEAFLDRGKCRCIFLFDGLNEVAPPYRNRLIEDLQLWMKAHPRHPVVVTSRSQDELWRRLRDEMDRAVVVQPVGDEQMEAYLVAHLDERGKELCGRLDGRLREMARTPLILWLVKEAGAAGESLPGNRGELYERFVGRMLRRDTQHRQLDAEIPDRTKIKALTGLAYHLSLEQRLSCPREEAVEIVAQALGDGQAEKVVRACARHGLLAGEETVWFAPHQTVQEHFAALALREIVESRGIHRFVAGLRVRIWATDERWVEPLVQLAGLVDSADWLVQQVERGNPWLAWWCVEEGREVSEETRETVERQSIRLLESERAARRWVVHTLTRMRSERAVRLLFRLVVDEYPPIASQALFALFEMGETARGLVKEALLGADRHLWRSALCYLGAQPNDPLFAEIPVKVWNEVLGQPMVWIPPGPFLMGSDKSKDSQAFDSEMPQHEVTLGGYWIGRYPVTNAEYWKFIEGGGYQTQWCWTEAGWKWKGDRIQPAYWGDEDYNDSQQPVVGVSWYEAVAYCRWLGGKTGLPMRLPSEAEWEKAARGIDGRIYPWGDECDVSKCNVSETGIGKAAPVGKFSPQGDSPYGCTDMIGNVWEWTSTLYADCPYQSDDRREDPEAGGFRVRRGGCFFDDVRSARAACRHASLPNSCREYFGFRVVCGAFPISPRSGS